VEKKARKGMQKQYIERSGQRGKKGKTLNMKGIKESEGRKRGS